MKTMENIKNDQRKIFFYVTGKVRPLHENVIIYNCYVTESKYDYEHEENIYR